VIGPTPRGVQTEILRFMMEIFVYRCLLLVSIIIILIIYVIGSVYWYFVCLYILYIYNNAISS